MQRYETWKNMEQIDASIKVRNYRPFSEEAQGFSVIRPMNLIIGRNNVGKSALLDAIAQLITPKKLTKEHHHLGENRPQFVISRTVDANVFNTLFPLTEFGENYYLPLTRFHFEQGLEGHKVGVSFDVSDPESKRSVEMDENKFINDQKYRDTIARNFQIPFRGYSAPVRLAAERDISPESSEAVRTLKPNGAGATNIIRLFTNHREFARERVTTDLLNALNEIVMVDKVQYTEILAQGDNNGLFEIFLVDKHRKRIALSNSGSGLKTIILVLIALFLTNDRPKNRIFLFEELENNLHPALQRALISFLLRYAKDNECYMFLTTHSSVSIDLLSHDVAAQIIHVTHNGEEAKVTSPVDYTDHTRVLDDLDIRASDLLQANCVLWVEGPTDRLYINRFLELYTAKNEIPLREGLHYQCVFYGGRVLKHLNAGNGTEEQKAGVRILNVSRNAAILMDSDRASAKDEINATKKRMRDEVTSAGGFAWVTDGREIENYLPFQAIEAVVPGCPKIRSFSKIETVLAKMEGWKSYKDRKVAFAEEVIPYITLEQLQVMPQLNEHLTKLIKYIHRCNGIISSTNS